MLEIAGRDNSVKDLLNKYLTTETEGLRVKLKELSHMKEKEKYFIIPSTNKQGTKHIEYELRDINGNKACIQCKTGYSSVDTEKIYKEFEGYTIFVCVMDESQNGKYNNTEKEVEEIPFHKLVKWAKDHKNLLPQRIQNYIELTEN